MRGERYESHCDCHEPESSPRFSSASGYGDRASLRGHYVIPLCALVSLATTCGDGVDLISHFALEPCPQSDYTLPDSASDGTYAVTSRVPKQFRKGSLEGGKVFLLYNRDKKEHYFEARLPSAACEVEIVWGYVGSATSPDSARERENNQRAAIVARLLMMDAGVAPDTSATRIERLVSK